MLCAVAVLAALAGAWAGGRGVGLLRRGLRSADDPRAPLWVIRGIRGIVVAVSAAALAGGILFEQTWLLVFGAIFLAEELYETGVVALVLRAGHAGEAARRRSASAVASSAAKKHSTLSSWSVMS
jgi:hypothetical protein